MNAGYKANMKQVWRNMSVRFKIGFMLVIFFLMIGFVVYWFSPGNVDVSFEIQENEIFGIAGESGCGKSTLLKVLYDNLQYPLEIKEGRVVLEYKNQSGKMKTMQSGEIRNAWWDAISYVPQAAMSVLNPVYRIEEQFYELFRRHRKNSGRAEMKERVYQYIKELNLPMDILKSYPHQLSGGMRQRVVIAMAYHT